MSLEEALAENTAAMKALTAALGKSGAATASTDSKAGGSKPSGKSSYEAKHSKEEMQAAMQEVKEKLGMDAAKKIRSEVAKVDKLADLTDAKVIDAVYDAAKAAVKAKEAKDAEEEEV